MYGYFDDSVIYLTQGNKLQLEISLKDEETGDAIILEGDNYILLTVENQNHKKVIQKKLTSSDTDPETGVVTCTISSSETVNMPTGEYPYDCLYVSGGDDATTFAKSSIVIQKAIGKYTDSFEEGGATSS